MPSDVNERILNKIEDGPYKPDVKSFLKMMLGRELEHFSEAIWHFSKDYETEIVRHVKK